MIVHIDGDVLVYRAGFAAEHTIWKVEGSGWSREFENKKDLNAFMEENPLPVAITSRKEVEAVENALFNARSMVRTIEEKMEADQVVLYLSGPTNFRSGLATILPYKGNRDPAHKPVHGPAIKAMLRREYNVVTSEDQEADDDIAIAHYGLWVTDPFSSVIATIDKDLDMVPGLHYNFARDEQYYIEPEEGIRRFYQQLLKGDKTDNIPGVPGIGEVKAKKLLADCKTELDMYKVASALYVQAYGEKAHDALVENGQLLWMRRQPNEFWLPPEDIPYD